MRRPVWWRHSSAVGSGSATCSPAGTTPSPRSARPSPPRRVPCSVTRAIVPLMRLREHLARRPPSLATEVFAQSIRHRWFDISKARSELGWSPRYGLKQMVEGSLSTLDAEVCAEERMTARHMLVGGAGFLGSHLSDELIARDEEVVVVDREGCDDADARMHEARVLAGDITDRASIEHHLRLGDVVHHLAGLRGAARMSAARLHEVNVEGAVNVATAARTVVSRRSCSRAASGRSDHREAVRRRSMSRPRAARIRPMVRRSSTRRSASGPCRMARSPQ